MEKGVHQAPPLAEELLVTDGYWGREDQFSSEMQALRSYNMSSRWSYTHAHTGITKGGGLYEVGREKSHRGEIGMREKEGFFFFFLSKMSYSMKFSNNKKGFYPSIFRKSFKPKL